MKNADNLVVTPSPHLKSSLSISRSMWDVILALIPITLVSIYFYETHAIFVIAVCIAACYCTEFIIRKLMGKKITFDGSTILTGLLLALCFSPTSSWWRLVLASILAIGVAKELMGGLGWNRFNPALFGRGAVILFASWFGFLSRIIPSIDLGRLDVVTTATPLALLSSGLEMPGYLEMFLAYPGGALAETSPLALLIGGAYLLYRKHISWHIPVSMLGSLFVLTLITGQNPVYHILSGGLLLGALFMATDWVTSPNLPQGKLIFGAAIGILVFLFRVTLAPTGGVAYSILIMNAFVPVIEKLTLRLNFSEPLPKGRMETADQITLNRSM